MENNLYQEICTYLETLGMETEEVGQEESYRRYSVTLSEDEDTNVFEPLEVGVLVKCNGFVHIYMTAEIPEMNDKTNRVKLIEEDKVNFYAGIISDMDFFHHIMESTLAEELITNKNKMAYVDYLKDIMPGEEIELEPMSIEDYANYWKNGKTKDLNKLVADILSSSELSDVEKSRYSAAYLMLSKVVSLETLENIADNLNDEFGTDEATDDEMVRALMDELGFDDCDDDHNHD